MKVTLQEARPWLYVVGVLLVAALIVWFVWLRPSDAELEADSAKKGQESVAAQTKAEAGIDAAGARIDAVPRPVDQAVFEATIREIRRGIEANNATMTQMLAGLAQRSQVRAADVQRIATLAPAETQAQIRELVGEPLSGSETALKAVLHIAKERDQARDEAATRLEVIAAKDKQIAAEQKAQAETAIRLEETRKFAERIEAVANTNKDEFKAALAAVNTAHRAEVDAKDAQIRRLRGNRFMNAVKTGVRVGAGIGIGIAIGRVMN